MPRGVPIYQDGMDLDRLEEICISDKVGYLGFNLPQLHALSHETVELCAHPAVIRGGL